MKSTLKKWISAGLAAVLALNLFVPAAYADIDAGIADPAPASVADALSEVNADAAPLTFTYPSPEGLFAPGDDYEATCYYTDGYFGGSSFIYNPSLATMSLALAMAGSGSLAEGSGYSHQDQNIRALFRAIGMDESRIEANEWFYQRPTRDSIGVAVGSKSISVDGEDSTLIAVVIRGGGYGAEWASNFTLGAEGEHAGFHKAKDDALDFLRGYIARQQIEGPVTWWITGYSRGGAVANLLGGAIDNDLSQDHPSLLGDRLRCKAEDVYVYCFEPPANTDVEEAVDYGNIFNILNYDDLVVYSVPAVYGFGRYGINLILPARGLTSNYDELEKKVSEIFTALGSHGEYNYGTFQMKKLGLRWKITRSGSRLRLTPSLIQNDTANPVAQGTFFSDYWTYFATKVGKNREYYATNREDDFREIAGILFGLTYEQLDQLTASLESIASRNTATVARTFRNYLLLRALRRTDDRDMLFQLLSDWLNAAVRQTGYTDYSPEMVDHASKELAPALLSMILGNLNGFVTLVENSQRLTNCHLPDLAFAWVSSMDKNYDPEAKVTFANGLQRIVSVYSDQEDAVQVSAYASADTASTDGSSTVSLADATLADTASADGSSTVSPADATLADTTSADGSFVSSLTEDEKTTAMVFPSDQDYGFAITAKEDCMISLNAVEYLPLSGEYTRNVNFVDVPLAAGDTLRGTLSGKTLCGTLSGGTLSDDTPRGTLSGGTLSDIVLCDADGHALAPAADLAGEDAKEALYEVSVRASQNYTAEGDEAAIRAAQINAVESDVPETVGNDMAAYADAGLTTAGIVLGGGVFPRGRYATVEAVPAEGFTFDGWFADGKKLSAETEYTFRVEKDCVLEAHFLPQPSSVTPVTPAKPTLSDLWKAAHLGGRGIVKTIRTVVSNVVSLRSILLRATAPETSSKTGSMFTSY